MPIVVSKNKAVFSWYKFVVLFYYHPSSINMHALIIELLKIENEDLDTTNHQGVFNPNPLYNHYKTLLVQRQ